MQDITFDGYHLPTLAKIARAIGRPTTGAFASLMWELSNRATLPSTLAVELMVTAGYQPFQGYPLKRV